MVNRRAMGTAMVLSEDKLNFIRGDSKEQSTVSAVPLASEVEVATEVEPQTKAPANEPGTSVPSIPRPSKSKQSRSNRHESVEVGYYDKILVPLTTRLKAPTADALRRACLEQKLGRRSPDSQQEIVEVAVVSWLLEHGYL